MTVAVFCNQLLPNSVNNNENVIILRTTSRTFEDDKMFFIKENLKPQTFICDHTQKIGHTHHFRLYYWNKTQRGSI
jgi:hypothetical protein